MGALGRRGIPDGKKEVRGVCFSAPFEPDYRGCQPADFPVWKGVELVHPGGQVPGVVKP